MATNQTRAGRCAATLAALAMPAMLALPTATAQSPLYARVLTALGAVHSYRGVMTFSTSGGADGPSSMKMEVTMVGSGKARQEYLRMTAHRGTSTAIVVEMVIGSKHTCFRTASSPAWNCGMPSLASLTDTATLLNTDLLKRLSFKPVGGATVLGRQCDGFQVWFRADTSVAASGTLWIARDTSLPVEELGTATTTVAGKTTHATFTAVWGNWNDPSLRIPPTPGA